MDRTFRVVIIGAAMRNLALSAGLVPAIGEMGMAWAVVMAELFVVAGVYCVLRRRKLDPLFGRKSVE